MPIPYSQRDSRWAKTHLDSSGLTMDLFGCLVSSTIFQINRHLGTNDTPGEFCDWLNRNAGFNRDGAFYWSKVSEYTRRKLHYVGSGFAAKLKKKYTIQQVDFGRIKHFVARLPAADVYDPWQGRIVKNIGGTIEIEGHPRRLLNNFRYLG